MKTDWLFGLYFGLVGSLVKLLIFDSVTAYKPTAYSSSILVTLLVAYPIFILGKKVPKTRWSQGGGQWTFTAWTLVSVTGAALSYVLGVTFLE
ncbi:MAG: hypothetical protein J2P41_23130 [Blastocatellia bacterium]|nr:hypothetical protein [Blastocatellia bacterium]